MVKRLTSMQIESDIIESCKKRFINMSNIAQKALEEALGKKCIEIDMTTLQCQKCGVEMRKATKEDLNGLVWAFPEEEWLCPRCDSLRIKKLEQEIATRGLM